MHNKFNSNFFSKKCVNLAIMPSAHTLISHTGDQGVWNPHVAKPAILTIDENGSDTVPSNYSPRTSTLDRVGRSPLLDYTPDTPPTRPVPVSPLLEYAPSVTVLCYSIMLNPLSRLIFRFLTHSSLLKYFKPQI